MFAVMRDAVIGLPETADQFDALFKNALIVIERDVEWLVFALVVAATAGEIDAPARQEIERRPLLGDANGMMQRRHIHGGRQPDVLGVGCDISEHDVRAGQHAERIEVVLADPGGVHAELVGIERLGGNVGDELVRGAGVIVVVIVAQREIAEVHDVLPVAVNCDPLRP